EVSRRRRGGASSRSRQHTFVVLRVFVLKAAGFFVANTDRMNKMNRIRALILSVPDLEQRSSAFLKWPASPTCSLSSASASPQGIAREEAVELVGEALAVRQVERRGAARLLAGAAHRIQEIAQRQALADVVGRIELAAGIDGVAAALDHD